MNVYVKSGIAIVSGLLLLISNDLSLAENKSNSQSQNSGTRVIFKPKGEPNRTSGGGSRNERLCPQDREQNNPKNQGSSLIALVPSEQVGLTVAPHPTVWIKLSPTSAKQMIFNIREKGDKSYYQSVIAIDNRSGLMSLSVPADIPELVPGKVYEWSVVLVCGETPHPNDPSITASIERVSPASVPSLTGVDMASWYAERGYWYDALNQLGEMRQKSPDDADIEKTWQDFLKSGGVSF